MLATGIRAHRWLILTLALASGFWAFDLAGLRAGVPDPLDDTWEYGVVARSLIEGRGFRTQVIHPPLWSLRDGSNTVPVLIHGPLVPLALAPRVRLFGPRALEWVPILAAELALLAAFFAYRIGARHFGPPAGAAAALLWTLSPLTLRAVHHDIALTAGAALLMLALDLLLQPRRSAALAGLALGLGYLARPELLLAAPVLLGLAGRTGWRTALAFAACATPWWLHNAAATGSPLFNLSSYLAIGYWDGRPELTVLRDFALSPAAWPHALGEALPSLPAKWLEFFPHAVKRALLVPTAASGWLALVGLAAALRAPETRRAAVAALLIALVPVAVMTTTVYDDRYLTPFLPLWAIAVALGARTLAAALPAAFPEWARPPVWLSALAVLALPSVIPAVREAEREARVLERRLAFEKASLAPLTLGAATQRALLFSDLPDFAAWTADRPVVWVTREEFGWLPAQGEPNPRGLPERGSATATWFHVTRGAESPPKSAHAPHSRPTTAKGASPPLAPLPGLDSVAPPGASIHMRPNARPAWVSTVPSRAPALITALAASAFSPRTSTLGIGLDVFDLGAPFGISAWLR
jgi:hypothetical protein